MQLMAIGRALATVLTPLIMVPLSYFGIEATTTVGEAIEILMVGALTGISTLITVYLVPDKK